jgi:hypothetical protein
MFFNLSSSLPLSLSLSLSFLQDVEYKNLLESLSFTELRAGKLKDAIHHAETILQLREDVCVSECVRESKFVNFPQIRI